MPDFGHRRKLKGIITFPVVLFKFTYIIAIYWIICKINLVCLNRHNYPRERNKFITRRLKKCQKCKKDCNLFYVSDVFINEHTNTKVGKMKKISRREAETLIQTSSIVDSDVVQDQNEMRVLLTLTNDQTFLLKYDLHYHDKSYFIT